MPTTYRKEENGLYTPIVTIIRKDGGKSVDEKPPLDLAKALVARMEQVAQVQEERSRLVEQLQHLDDEEVRANEDITVFKTLLGQEVNNQLGE